MTRRIGFFIFPQFQLLDLSGPLTAFQFASEKPAAIGLRSLQRAPAL